MENVKELTEEEELKRVIADNLIYYRKMNNLTQAKLAELLNYSDKAVSKWERADGVPDIFILTKLAQLYHVSVNDLLTKKKKRRQVSFFRNRLVISLLSVGVNWLTFIVAFAILKMIEINIHAHWDSWLWILFIYPILASFIISLVFAKLWGKRWMRFFLVSGIVFSSGLVIFSHLMIAKVDYSWIIWTICAAVEVLVILWYCLIRKKKDPDV